MATFGNTDTTVDNAVDAKGHHAYIVAHCPEAGTANFIKAVIDSAGGNCKAKCALYTSDDVFLAATEVKTLAMAQAQITFNFADPKPSLVHDDYHIVLMTEEVGDWQMLCYKTVIGQSTYTDNDDAAYPTFNDPLGTSHTAANAAGDIYCDYTATAEGQPYMSRVQGIRGMRTW